MDRLGKTDAEIAREREDKQKPKVYDCKGYYWEAKSGGRDPYCRRGNQYGNRCREFKQT